MDSRQDRGPQINSVNISTTHKSGESIGRKIGISFLNFVGILFLDVLLLIVLLFICNALFDPTRRSIIAGSILLMNFFLVVIFAIKGYRSAAYGIAAALCFFLIAYGGCEYGGRLADFHEGVLKIKRAPESSVLFRISRGTRVRLY